MYHHKYRQHHYKYHLCYFAAEQKISVVGVKFASLKLRWHMKIDKCEVWLWPVSTKKAYMYNSQVTTSVINIQINTLEMK